ncbi:MAG: hypothetical protein ACLQVI_16175 [Polyangiaceae bacterium]
MRRRSYGVPYALALAASLAAAPVACVDLFHSTNFETACDVDAAACAPGDGSSSAADAGPLPFPANFCAWDPTTARANALHACAWLGACAGPVGDNAFGPCFVQAMLAYDCAANPNRQLRPGPAHDLWDHLRLATSCADVLAALLPSSSKVPACGASPSPFEACYTNALLSCGGEDSGPPITEGFASCGALGQICASSGAVAACAGSSSACTGNTAEDAGCAGTQLHDCDPDASPFDQGVDCASFGAGQCVSGSPAACLAESDASCTPTSAITCNSTDVVSGCPSGFTEQVDCRALLGMGGCNSAGAGRPWDVSRACTFGTGCSDSCTESAGGASSLLNGCVRGAFVSVDCAAVGFSTCAILQDDPAHHAVCVQAAPEDAGAN